jgi:hypothetical protein
LNIRGQVAGPNSCLSVFLSLSFWWSIKVKLDQSGLHWSSLLWLLILFLSSARKQTETGSLILIFLYHRGKES